MLNSFVLNVIMLSVVMLNVEAPLKPSLYFCRFPAYSTSLRIRERELIFSILSLCKTANGIYRIKRETWKGINRLIRTSFPRFSTLTWSTKKFKIFRKNWKLKIKKVKFCSEKMKTQSILIKLLRQVERTYIGCVFSINSVNSR